MLISQCAFVNANSTVHEYITGNTGNTTSDRHKLQVKTSEEKLTYSEGQFCHIQSSNFAEKSFWTQAHEQVD